MQNALFAQVSTLQMHVIKPTKIAMLKKQISYAQCVKKKEKNEQTYGFHIRKPLSNLFFFITFTLLFRYEETEYFPTVFSGRF